MRSQAESSHPQHRTVIQFCKALNKVPGLGHERADRLQQALLSPSALAVRQSLHEVLLLNPLLDAVDKLGSLARALLALGIQCHDHEYQATLRRWLDGQKQSSNR